MNKFTDEEVYPVNYSAGGINAYYVSDCDAVGHRPAYCICVNKIQAFERSGELKDCECNAPIRNRTCSALRMRSEELKAGRSIYFVNRKKLEVFAESQKKVPQESVSKVKKQPMIYPAYVLEQMGKSSEGASVESSLSVSDKSSVIDSVDDMGYSAAINTAIAKEQLKSAKAVVEGAKAAVAAMVPLPGESLLEMARRLASFK